jgi:hypothetical protein
VTGSFARCDRQKAALKLPQHCSALAPYFSCGLQGGGVGASDRHHDAVGRIDNYGNERTREVAIAASTTSMTVRLAVKRMKQRISATMLTTIVNGSPERTAKMKGATAANKQQIPTATSNAIDPPESYRRRNFFGKPLTSGELTPPV